MPNKKDLMLEDIKMDEKPSNFQLGLAIALFGFMMLVAGLLLRGVFP